VRLPAWSLIYLKAMGRPKPIGFGELQALIELQMKLRQTLAIGLVPSTLASATWAHHGGGHWGGGGAGWHAHEAWHGDVRHFDHDYWHGGHWWHGSYGGRIGWWWIVGPDW
jgi:hypothetical protein